MLAKSPNSSTPLTVSRISPSANGPKALPPGRLAAGADAQATGNNPAIGLTSLEMKRMDFARLIALRAGASR